MVPCVRTASASKRHVFNYSLNLHLSNQPLLDFVTFNTTLPFSSPSSRQKCALHCSSVFLRPLLEQAAVALMAAIEEKIKALPCLSFAVE